MMAIFHDMIEKTIEVFMDDFSVFGNSFGSYLSRVDKMFQMCEHTNLCLNWEKSHFMVKEGIVLGHKISKNRIEFDKAKVDVIAKLPHPTTVKGILAASTIAISSDSSNESVGSPPSRVILFGDIPTVIPSTSVVAPETSTIAPVISSIALVVETTLVGSPTGVCGLVPYSDSDSDSPDEMSSPEHISSLPAISPFLCINSSKAPDSSDRPPSQDPYVMAVARWRSKVASRPSSSSEFPIALVTALPRIRRWSVILIRPREAIPFGRPYRTHLNGPRKLLTARKRVGLLPAHRLAWRYVSPRASDHCSSSSSSSSDSLC
ncbi:hypothetical protein Tco_1052770 [Tanacetum coccineum]